MKVKSIQWSYPNSDNAKKFGYKTEGCYTLQIGEHNQPLEAVAACRELAPLVTQGNQLFNREWLQYIRGNGYQTSQQHGEA
jgi:hypothetical protein